MRLPFNSEIWRWILIAVAALTLAGVTQRDVERRRTAANLTWSNPDNKEALEVGFLALGGFRGIVADVLWVRATRLQEAGKYYELKLLCGLIQKLQPTFAQVHAFQAWNMSYNLARRGATCEDKWYWIRSGLAALEKGIERGQRNHSLWFELGFTYMDRLGDIKMEDCAGVRQRELPNIDDIPEARRILVFSKPDEWLPGRARPGEHLRWAAYYFWRSMQTGTDPNPLRVERVYGHCLERLHLFRTPSDAGEKTHWNDWGAEDWWLEILRRNTARGLEREPSVPTNLRWCMYQQIDYFQTGAKHYADNNAPGLVPKYEAQAEAAYQRLLKYFPDEKRSRQEVMAEYYQRVQAAK
jgi:hypothetical protein